jgi:hypothetical protein
LEASIGVLRAERDAADLVVDQPNVNVAPPGSPQPAPERPTDEAAISAHDTRLAVNRQIEEAIAAFEAIRVDLLRIRSGVGTHDELESGTPDRCARTGPPDTLRGETGVTGPCGELREQRAGLWHRIRRK